MTSYLLLTKDTVLFIIHCTRTYHWQQINWPLFAQRRSEAEFLVGTFHAVQPSLHGNILSLPQPERCLQRSATLVALPGTKFHRFKTQLRPNKKAQTGRKAAGSPRQVKMFHRKSAFTMYRWSPKLVISQDRFRCTLTTGRFSQFHFF